MYICSLEICCTTFTFVKLLALGCCVELNFDLNFVPGVLARGCRVCTTWQKVSCNLLVCTVNIHLGNCLPDVVIYLSVTPCIEATFDLPGL